MQRTAPAHLVRIALRRNHLLRAQLQNDSDNPIAAYQIGWANVGPNGIVLRQGSLTSLRERIKPRFTDDLPDQAVSFDEHVQKIIFFVSELRFANGSVWKADINEIEHEAAGQTDGANLR